MKSNLLNKYLILSVLGLTAGLGAQAQGIYDALRFSKIQYEGTARSLAMGNAFTALGGDLGAVVINPAATGLYRYSEFAFTPSLNISSDRTGYLGTVSRENRTRFGISNLGYVASLETGRTRGLLNFNIGIVLNQNAKFNASTTAAGRNESTSFLGGVAGYSFGIDPKELGITDTFDPYYQTNHPGKSILAYNTYLIYPVYDADKQFTGNYIGANETITSDGKIVLAGPQHQRYSRVATGYASDVALTFGGNISDKLFFGFNLGIQSLWYSRQELLSETALYENKETYFRSFSYNYDQVTSGTGVNLQAGVIFLPVRGLRLGASVSSPTWYFLRDQWMERMDSDVHQQTFWAESPVGIYDYRIRTPFRWNVGAAYTFGKIGLVSVDYERVDYRSIRMSDGSGSEFGFAESNTAISRTFMAGNIFRAGAEVRVLPQLSLRAGYNYYGRTDSSFNDELHLVSGGIGYAAPGGFFADLAYQHQLNSLKEEFAFFSYPAGAGVTAPAAESIYRSFRVLLTVGLRF